MRVNTQNIIECRSEMYCARLAENTGCKKSPKHSPSGHHWAPSHNFVGL